MKQMIEESAVGPIQTNPPAAPKPFEGREHMTRVGAMALAKRLEKYWHDRGYYAARFWAEPIDERFAKIGTREIYRVVCNLVNGLPPVYRDQAAGPNAA